MGDEKSDSILEARVSVVNACNLSKRLKALRDELRVGNFDTNQWNNKVNYYKYLKNHADLFTNKLNSNELGIYENQSKVQGHSKFAKRRRKKCSALKQLKKLYDNEEKKKLSIEFDNWIKEEQNEINREKKQVALSRDADIVLQDTKVKRADVKKYLTILRELGNLRKVEVTLRKPQQGLFVDQADSVFQNIITKLMQQWTALDREYFLEEKGLRLMLKTENEEETTRHTKSVDGDWEITLFKNKIPNEYSPKIDIQNFITRRRLLDQYIDPIQGSEIPLGWVLPQKPSPSSWDLVDRRTSSFDKDKEL